MATRCCRPSRCPCKAEGGVPITGTAAAQAHRARSSASAPSALYWLVTFQALLVLAAFFFAKVWKKGTTLEVSPEPGAA